ncbi:hypothetical protein [Gemmata sp.]|uniref:hypothetical protein n=1 Tax=Gemmata sp. TaxID=1914242 RepID=UPI003F71B918
MPYTDFDLALAESRLGVMVRPIELFPDLAPVQVPAWLPDHLARGRELALLTEKARSELLIAPILLAAREAAGRSFAIFSGQRMDVDPARGLTGECDFVLSRQDAVPVVRAPVMIVLEAKRGDIEGGVGQCLAQMVGAQTFNERAGQHARVFGCVTTGEDWQFLRLDGSVAGYDTVRRYVNDLSGLLAVFCAIAATGRPAAAA